MRHPFIRPLAIAALAVCMGPTAKAADTVPGQKIDSDLGSLPPFTQWDRHPQLRRYVRLAQTRVAGEKLDSGVGSLPPYSQWHRHPELARLAAGPAAPAVRTASVKLTQVATVRD